MKLAVVGSRDYDDYEFIKKTINEFIAEKNIILTHIVSGGAKGVDKCAERYAKEYGLELIIHLPDYEKYDRAAPLVRNELIAIDCDIMIAFRRNESSGTKNALDWAEKHGKETKEITIKYVSKYVTDRLKKK